MASFKRAVRIDIFLRAVAILLVAFNHAVDMLTRNNWLNGGMSVLMMVSGMAFARLALDNGTGERATLTLTRFAGKLFTATLAIVILTTPVRETSLLVASGLIYTFTELPFWYGVQMAAICLVLAGLFATPPFAKAFFRNPRTASLVLLALALLIHVVCEQIWDTHLMEHRLPHLIAWNFLLGWALHFLLANRERGLALTVVIASAAVGWGLKSDAGYLVVGALAASSLPSVRLKPAVAHATHLIAQATFFIYLTSWIFIVGFAHAVLKLIPAPAPAIRAMIVVTIWIGGVAASTALWVGFTAVLRSLHSVARTKTLASR